MPAFDDPRTNQLLAAMPAEEWQRWSAQLEPVQLALGQVLYESGSSLSHVYFPTSSIVSLLYVMENGASAEIAIAGNEGNQLNVHADTVKQVAARKMLVLGLQHFSADDLKRLKAARQKLDIRVLGLASIAHDVSPELALATIDSLQVLGALQASPEVKAALAKRQR